MIRGVVGGVLFGGGSGTTIPLRIAEVQGRLFNQETNNAAMDSVAFRWPHAIPNAVSSIVLSFNAWYQNTTGLTETNISNSITVGPVSFTAPNGTVVPVRFDGARTKVLTAGDYDIQSDPIDISHFGYNSSNFPTSGTWWSKGIITASVGGYFPSSNTMTASDVSNSQAVTYLSSSTTPSSTDVDGVYTATGTAFTTLTTTFRPVVLGRPASSSGIYFAAIGDSIGSDVGDITQNGVGGRGSIQRAMWNNGVYPFACINMCRGSGRQPLFTTGTKWRSYLSYANVLIDELNTNDVTDGTALETIQTNQVSLWNLAKSAGISRIYRTTLMTRCSSSDSYVTLVNQTPAANFGPTYSGSLLKSVNDWYATKESDGTITKVISLSDMVDATEPNKWKTTTGSSIGLMNADTVHPNTQGHKVMAGYIRAAVEPIVMSFDLMAFGPTVLYDTRTETSILDANGANPSAGGFLGACATLTDLAAVAGNATQSTSTKRPAFPRTAYGSVRGLDFDGTDDFMVVPNTALIGGNQTIITVSVPDVTTAGTYLLANSGTGGGNTRSFSANQGCDFGSTLLSLASPTSGSVLVQIVRASGTGASAKQFVKVNNVAESIGTVNRNGATVNPVALGAYGNGASANYNGTIVIACVVQRLLYAPEVNRIGSALVAAINAAGGSATWSDVST